MCCSSVSLGRLTGLLPARRSRLLLCVAVCCSVLQSCQPREIDRAPTCEEIQRAAVCCSVLQCVAVLQSCQPRAIHRAAPREEIERAAVCCSMLQCVAVRCSPVSRVRLTGLLPARKLIGLLPCQPSVAQPCLL